MNANDYQVQAMEFALPTARNLPYMLFGACNETGEVAGKYKKVLRGDVLLENAYEDIGKELGDALWYIAGAADACGFLLGDLMRQNLTKLRDRQQRGVIQGNGDNR